MSRYFEDMLKASMTNAKMPVKESLKKRPLKDGTEPIENSNELYDFIKFNIEDAVQEVFDTFNTGTTAFADVAPFIEECADKIKEEILWGINLRESRKRKMKKLLKD